MSAVNQDIQVFQGEDNTIPFTIYVPGSNNTQPQDITGWTLSFKVWPIQGGAILVTKTPTITTPTQGKGNFVVLQADLTTLQSSSVWNYRLERIDAGSDNWLTYGKLTIVTR
jgi:hypothetical protein